MRSSIIVRRRSIESILSLVIGSLISGVVASPVSPDVPRAGGSSASRSTANAPNGGVAGGIIPTTEGLIATTTCDPDWVLAVSDAILREYICVATCGPGMHPGCCFQPEGWYDRTFAPCYPWTTEYYKFADETASGSTFPIYALGAFPHTDSIYIRAGITAQLHALKDDGGKEPPPPADDPESPWVTFGPPLEGPRYVSVDFWIKSACNGFEPNTLDAPQPSIWRSR